MAEALRWGVLGASSRMYRTRILGPMQASDRHVVVAEASRDASGSEQPYADLLARPESIESVGALAAQTVRQISGASDRNVDMLVRLLPRGGTP